MVGIKLEKMSMETYGTMPSVGDDAPDFILTQHDMMPVGLSDFAGQYVLLNVYPSIDTETCFRSVVEYAKWFKDNKDKKNNAVNIVSVSMDLPYALERNIRAEIFEGVQFLSDFRDHTFGAAYGILINTGPLAGLLARSVFLINPDKKIEFVQLTEDLSIPCNYEEVVAVLNAVK